MRALTVYFGINLKVHLKAVQYNASSVTKYIDGSIDGTKSGDAMHVNPRATKYLKESKLVLSSDSLQFININ